MLKTGLVNVGLGIAIALVGAVITAVSYEAASGGGTYVVTYGAIVVGAWRILLGLFQILRGAFERNAPASPATSQPQRIQTPIVSNVQAAPIPRNVSNVRTAENASGALRIVGGVMIAQAALRTFSLGILLSHVPSSALLSYVPYLLTTVVLPVILIIGGLAAGAWLLRAGAAAVPFAAGVCVVGLLFQAYGLVRLLTLSSYQVPWVAWAFSAVHLTIYIVCLAALMRSSNGRAVAAA